MQNVFCVQTLNSAAQANPLTPLLDTQGEVALRPSGEPSGASADLWFIDAVDAGTAADSARMPDATRGAAIAVKVMRHGLSSSSATSSPAGSDAFDADFQKLQDEYETLRHMNGARGHAPIAYALGWRIKRTSRGEVRYPALAMQYIDGIDISELRDALAKERGSVTSAQVTDAAKAIVVALLSCTVVSHDDARYLTTVSHRDLSSHNLRFLMADTSARIERALLIDFGQSTQNDDPNVTAADGSERLSTPFIGAPEIFDQRPSEARQWRNSSYADCYSIGCLLYYLRCGSWPLEDQIRSICASGTGGLGRVELQALFELKNRAAIHLDDAHRLNEGDRALDTLIARCTEPGIGKVDGRLDIVRLAERLGIDEHGRTLADTSPALPEQPPQNAPAPTAPSARRRMRSSIRRIAATALAIALALAIGLYAVGRNVDTDSDPELALYPKTALSAGQLRQSVSLVQARLDAADLGKAATIESMDGICVTLAADALDTPGESSSSAVHAGSAQASSSASQTSTTAEGKRVYQNSLEALLARPLELYLVKVDSEGNGIEASEHIYRTEVEGVEVKTGSVEGLQFDASTDSKQYPYLELTLTDAGQKRLRDACSDWYDEGSIGFDIGESSWDVVSTASLGKGRYAFASKNLAPSAQLCEVLAAALRSDSYRAAFDGELLPQAVWINRELTGKNQVDVNDVEGDATVISFSSYGVLTTGERIDAIGALAKRLDALGVPYALGDTDDGYGLVAKIQSDAIGSNTAKLICANPSVVLACGLERRALQKPSLELTTGSDGAQAVKLGEDSGINEITQVAADAGGAWVYLKIGGTPVLRAWVDKASSELVFDTSCSTGKTLSSSDKWLADLTVTVATTEVPSMHVDYCGREDLSLADVPGTLDAEVVEARASIKAVYPAAKVGVDAYDDTNLLISLDLSVDDSFAQASINTVEELYRAIDFDASPFGQVTFLLAEENETERARIFFVRRDGVGKDSGSVIANGSIRGGRFEEQRQRIIDAASNSSFFQERMGDASSWLL